MNIKSEGRAPLLLVLCAALFSFASTFAFYYANRDFQLDDAAIYRKVIGNVISYGSWTYNLDSPTNALTSFLYPLVALIAYVVTKIELRTLLPFLDCCFLFGGSICLALFFLRRNAVLSGLLAAVAFPLVLPIGNYLGMETSLLLFSFSALLVVFPSDRLRTALVSLFPLIRPEGIVLLGAELLWTVGKKLIVGGPTWSREIFRLFLSGLPTVGMLAFNFVLFGNPLPRSVANKVEQGRAGFLTLRKVAKEFLLHGYHDLPWHTPLFFLAVLGVVALVTKVGKYQPASYLGLAIGFWQFGLFAADVAFYDWYLVPVFFLAVLLVLVGIEEVLGFVTGKLARGRGRCWYVVIPAVVCAACLLKVLWPSEVRIPETRNWPTARQQSIWP